MVKVLSFSSEQCFSKFTMLLVEGFSGRGLFRNLPEHVFWSPLMQKYVSYEGHLFLKMFKIESKFRKVKKKLEIIFRF